MNTLICINTSSELVGYEALALAFVLASFGQTPILHLGADCLPLLQDNNSRLYGMIQSLALYDIPNAYAAQALLVASLHENITNALCADDTMDLANFDCILNF